ncbi:MAG: cysteine rich repeat-containing protein [Pseudomonadota bacterium]
MRKLPALLLAAAMAIPATAQSQGLFEACGTDIEELCANVEPGEGRISACLYAHNSVLSDQCHAATEPVALLLERVFDRMQATYAACGEDIAEFCGDIAPGGGRVLQCLKANGETISVGCSAAISSLPGTGG